MVESARKHPPQVSVCRGAGASRALGGRLTACPLPRELLFKHPKRTATLSMRNTSVMKKGGVFSAEFLKVFLPSLLLSHLLAIGLG